MVDRQRLPRHPLQHLSGNVGLPRDFWKPRKKYPEDGYRQYWHCWDIDDQDDTAAGAKVCRVSEYIHESI